MDYYQTILLFKTALNIQELNHQLEAALSLLNIHTFSYSHYTYHPRSKQKLKYEYCSKNFLPWHEYYLSEQHEEIDTTLHACYLSTEPFIWMLDEQLAQAKTSKERQMRIDSINFGIQGGISIPIHGPNNDFAHLVLIQMNKDNFSSNLTHYT
jgi:LuxR family transcriptional activator of bioluminescence operon